MQTLITLKCPYCNNSYEVDPPIDAKSKDLGEMPVCLPYVRDIGRFDDGQWSRVGTDFFSKLKWEKVGILRVLKSDDLYYKVDYCTRCAHPFDVFINYTPNRLLKDIWPHLLRRDNIDSTVLSRYRAQPLYIRLINYFLGDSDSDSISVLAVCFFLSAMVSLPYLLSIYNYMEFHSISAVTEWVSSHVGFLTIQLLGILWLWLTLHALYTLIQYMRTTEDFHGMFDLTSNQTTYWLNFTMCRLVGVHDENGIGINIGGRFSPTQVSLSGYLSAIILVVSWLIAFSINPKTMNKHTFFYASSELLFWSIVAFFSGIATWIALNSSTYIVKIATKLPLRKGRIGSYRDIKPLRKIVNYSTYLMSLNLIFSLLLLSSYLFQNHTIFADSLWIILWLGLGVLSMLIVVGLSMKFYSKSVLFMGMSYAISMILITYFMNNMPFLVYKTNSIVIDFRVIITALFMSYIIYLHSRGVNQPIRALRQKNEANLHDHYNTMIDNLENKLESLTRHSEGQVEAIASLSNALRITFDLKKNRLESGGHSFDLIRPLLIVSPVWSAIIFPVLLNIVASLLYDRLK